jgi:hypothetical protein
MSIAAYGIPIMDSGMMDAGKDAPAVAYGGPFDAGSD